MACLTPAQLETEAGVLTHDQSQGHLFPWMVRYNRWKKHALKRYRDEKKRYRQAKRTAMLARLGGTNRVGRDVGRCGRKIQRLSRARRRDDRLERTLDALYPHLESIMQAILPLVAAGLKTLVEDVVPSQNPPILPDLASPLDFPALG